MKNKLDVVIHEQRALRQDCLAFFNQQSLNVPVLHQEEDTSARTPPSYEYVSEDEYGGPPQIDLLADD